MLKRNDKMIITNFKDGLPVGQIAIFLEMDKFGYSTLELIDGERWLSRLPNFIKWSPAAELLYGVNCVRRRK